MVTFANSFGLQKKTPKAKALDSRKKRLKLKLWTPKFQLTKKNPKAKALDSKISTLNSHHSHPLKIY